MSDILQIARNRRQSIEHEAANLDDLALNIELFLHVAQRNRGFLAESFEHVDEYILYSEYMLESVADRLEALLKEGRKLDEFISFGEYLLQTYPDVPKPTKDAALQDQGGGGATSPGFSWLIDVVHRAQEHGQRAAREGNIQYVGHPFTFKD